ncbi:response regulator transcription factor [Pleurocapsa sp. PCC 7319]|uniref:response regulator transcription factor n=1 Tax=Pleurocapsa sp. PCC 7319 TaxID=118161 RepID=UPI00034CE679|nr:response regulator [Pleurocapsa sp. PCC 7319]
MSRILIAEDEARLAAFIEKGLRRNGYQIAIASDGVQALQMIRSGEFDLLLLDIGLPIIDGWTVLSELEANSINLSTIVVTASDDVSASLKRITKRVPDYICKPFRFAELLELIQVNLPNESVN